MLVKKSKFVWRKKNPPRAQMFRYFRIESPNKNPECLALFIEFNGNHLLIIA